MNFTVLGGIAALTLTVIAGQVPQTGPPLGLRRPAPVVEQLGPGLFRLNTVTVDTKSRELRITGRLNQVDFLEFVANSPGGVKSYESAFTLETDAVTLNAALLLIGMDKARSRVPTQHFDPIPPEGDPVELWFEAPDGRRRRIEELLLDRRSNTTLPVGPWVYTGSRVLPDGRYVAEVDGVLIGFVHSPAPIIENPRAGGVDAFGSIVLNTELGLAPLAPITLIIRAVDRTSRKLP